MKSKLYVVARGRKTGIFKSWVECKKHVFKYSGAVYKSFTDKKDATSFLKNKTKLLTGRHHENTMTMTATTRTTTTKRKKSKKRKRFQEKDFQENLVMTSMVRGKKMKIDNFLNIYTDGGCKGNGHSKAIGGIGVYFEHDTSKNISEKVVGKATNNIAELMAIVEAIKHSDTGSDIKIHTDSSYCINGILGINNRVKNRTLFESIDKLIKQRTGKIRFNKVKGHTGIRDGNFFADALATQAMRPKSNK